MKELASMAVLSKSETRKGNYARERETIYEGGKLSTEERKRN
jgi:hypothetical protein